MHGPVATGSRTGRDQAMVSSRAAGSAPGWMRDGADRVSGYRTVHSPFVAAGHEGLAAQVSTPRLDVAPRLARWRSFPPEGFIIGAQKAGTTTLAAMLDQHPEIAVARPKEPDFFHSNWNRGIDWYRSCFPEPRDILVDASPSYTMAAPDLGDTEAVPERIHALQPRARFIYLVRDPAERCHSAYWHEVRVGRERRSLRDAVRQRAYYTHASYYHRQLGGFLRFFPLEKFLFVPFERLIGEPIAVAAECARFLGATQPNFRFLDTGPKNQGFQYNRLGQFARDHLGERGLKLASGVISRLLPRLLHSRAKRVITQAVPGLADDDRAWLWEHFFSDFSRFELATGFRPNAARDASHLETDTCVGASDRHARAHVQADQLP